MFQWVVALTLVALISTEKVKISRVQNFKLERSTRHRVAAAKMTGLWNYAPGFIKISRNKQWNESCSIFKKENYLFEHLMSQSQEAVGVWNLPGFQLESNLSVLGMYSPESSDFDVAICVTLTISCKIISYRKTVGSSRQDLDLSRGKGKRKKD